MSNWYDFLRCEKLVPNFHKCEEFLPNSLMSDVSRLNPYICEKWYQIVICEKKNLYKTLTCEDGYDKTEELESNAKYMRVRGYSINVRNTHV